MKILGRFEHFSRLFALLCLAESILIFYRLLRSNLSMLGRPQLFAMGRLGPLWPGYLVPILLPLYPAFSWRRSYVALRPAAHGCQGNLKSSQGRIGSTRLLIFNMHYITYRIAAMQYLSQTRFIFYRIGPQHQIVQILELQAAMFDV